MAEISDYYCPFGALADWLQALDRLAHGRAPDYRPWRAAPWDGPPTRDRDLLVWWEDEGSEVCLLYRRGRLLFHNRGHAGWWRVRIGPADLVRRFREALRKFFHGGYRASDFWRLRTFRERFEDHAADAGDDSLEELCALPLPEVTQRLLLQLGEELQAWARTAQSLTGEPVAAGDWIRARLAGWRGASPDTRRRLLERLLDADASPR